MKFTFTSLAIFAVAACAGPSPFVRTPTSLPAVWRNSGNFPTASPSRDLSRWWQRFGDATLTSLITQALAQSPDLATASARIRESRARRDAEKSLLFPSLGGSSSSNSRSINPEFGPTSESTSYSANLDASWEIDLFGRQRSLINAASANLGTTQENFYSAQAALTSEIAIAYTNLRTNQAGLAILRRTVVTREETAKLASWRQQAGESDSLVSSQAISSLEQARASVPSLEQAAARNRNLISLLCGQNPGSLDSLLADGKNAIPTPPSGLAIGIPADTLRQRPDVRAAGYSLLAAAANTRAANALRYPSLNLSGSLGLSSLAASKLFNNPQTATASAIAGISSPIFDAGRIRATIAASDAAEGQAYQGYRSTVLTALSETEDALIACRRTAERLLFLEKATSAAREADTLARLRYQTGEIDFLAVLDTQRSLLGLEDNLLSTRADRTIAYIQLYKALGGGWSNP